MTVETQLKETKRKRTRVSQTMDEIFPFEPEPGANLIEPMRDFHTRSETDKLGEYRGFQIIRDGTYQLWSIQKDGKTIHGLAGLYTTISIAQKCIDEYLNNVEVVIEPIAPTVKNTKKKKKNDTAKNDTPSD